jgi:acetyl esterase/lipase
MLDGGMSQDDDLQRILQRDDNPLTTTQVVEAKDGDGNPMKIFITKPFTLKDEGNQPFFVYAHGGGAILFTAEIHN